MLENTVLFSKSTLYFWRNTKIDSCVDRHTILRSNKYITIKYAKTQCCSLKQIIPLMAWFLGILSFSYIVIGLVAYRNKANLDRCRFERHFYKGEITRIKHFVIFPMNPLGRLGSLTPGKFEGRVCISFKYLSKNSAYYSRKEWGALLPIPFLISWTSCGKSSS